MSASHGLWESTLCLFDRSLRIGATVEKLAPSVLGILLLPLLALRSRDVPIKVRSNLLLWIKLAAAVALIACRAAAAGFDSRTATSPLGATISIASLELLAAINVAVMVYMEHQHAARSSEFSAIYLILTAIADFRACQSLLPQRNVATLGLLAAAAACFRICLLVCDEMPKNVLPPTHGLRPNYRLGPLIENFRGMFVYFKSASEANFQHVDTAAFDEALSCKVTHERFRAHWTRTQEKTVRYRLIKACFLTWKWELILVLTSHLAATVCTSAQPFLIKQVIELLQVNEKDGDRHFGLAKKFDVQFLPLFIFIGLAVLKKMRLCLQNRLTVQIRGALLGQVMLKSHKLPENDAKSWTVHPSISSDIDRISEKLSKCLDAFMASSEAWLHMYSLSRYIGISCFVVLVPLLCTHVCSFLLAIITKPALAKWQRRAAVRVAKTTEVLKQLPGIKILGLGPTVHTYLYNLRIQELETSKHFRALKSLLGILQVFADLGQYFVVITVAFFWNGSDGTLSPVRLFPALTAVGLIADSTPRVLEIYADALEMVGWFGRIEAFLLVSELTDSRSKLKPSAMPSATTNSPAYREMNKQEYPFIRNIIQFSCASFGPEGLESPLLSEVNFGLPKGSISGVVGPTGCGKSAFFRSILGETKMTGGYVYSNHQKIAYCGPQAWLRDDSVRQNVIGDLPFEPSRYRMAIQSCQLEEDLRLLPGGDGYIVGLNGSNLSGGQRQRVSLARTVFAGCDITVIDDGLSALDPTTATLILEALCGVNGVFRRAHSTVLLSTFLPEILSTADQIITFDGHGGVVLNKLNLCTPERRQAIENMLVPPTFGPTVETEDREKAAIRRLWARKARKSTERVDHNYPEKTSRQTFSIFVKIVGKAKCLTLACAIIFMGSFEFLPEISLRMWAERTPEQGALYLHYTTAVFLACLLFIPVYWLLYCVVGFHLAIQLHKDILDVTMRATYGCITNINPTSFLHWFDEDAALFAQTLPRYFCRTLYSGIGLFCCTILVLWNTNYMAVTLPAVLLSVYLIQSRHIHLSRHARWEHIRQKTSLYNFFSETTDGILHIRAFGWQKTNLETGERLLAKSQKAQYLLLCPQEWLQSALDLLTAALAFYLVSAILWGKDDMSEAAAGQTLFSLSLFQGYTSRFTGAWAGWDRASSVFQRLEDFKAQTPLELDPPVPEDLPDDWPIAGDIELSNVSARYSESRAFPAVLRDVSLVIEPGERIALVGRSNSGKTSLLLTLLGFLDYSGFVEIDGVNLETVTPDILRSRVITMTQDTVQLNDTIRTNLLPFGINEEVRDDDLSKVQRATKDNMLRHVLQQLNIWGKLSSIGGLDAMLQDVGYSKGELQLLAVARGVVRRLETGINLVLMDEATSNLDPLRDNATHQFMQQVFQGCTVIIISQRQDVIQTTDCALRLNEGTIINVEIPNNPLTWLGAPMPTLPESEMEESGFDFEGGSGSASQPVVIP